VGTAGTVSADHAGAVWNYDRPGSGPHGRWTKVEDAAERDPARIAAWAQPTSARAMVTMECAAPPVLAAHISREHIKSWRVKHKLQLLQFVGFLNHGTLNINGER
jgi:hypothetical protein